jgi:hypothetical protein
MSQNFILKVVLFWPEICHQITSDKSFGLSRTCNDTGLEIFNMEQNSKEHTDDFKDLLNTSMLKISSGILCFLLITFTNAFNILLSMFEKHGGDPMKRSLKNQLVAQMGYSVIINNTICTPLLAWRMNFGPLTPEIAAFNSFWKNISMSWALACLTELFVVKALMLNKFSYMAGLDDTFMSRFIFLENLGFLFLSQLSRFYLGSMYESIEFQVLSGIMVEEEPYFWPIYMTMMLFIFGMAYGSITTKKLIEKFKEYKLQKRSKVNIQDNLLTISGQDKSRENKMTTPLKVNNFKYNVPLLNGTHFAVLGATFFIIGTISHLFLIYVYATMEDKMIPYQSYLFRRFFLESILFCLVLPILYLATNRDVLRFMKNIIN